jgi:hypothetical protein
MGDGDINPYGLQVLHRGLLQIVSPFSITCRVVVGPRSLVGWPTRSQWMSSKDRCNNSAPGLDGIKFIMFKFLPEEAKRYLLGIFNEVVSSGMIPGSWLRTKVVPILKPRKDPELSDF